MARYVAFLVCVLAGCSDRPAAPQSSESARSEESRQGEARGAGESGTRARAPSGSPEAAVAYAWLNALREGDVARLRQQTSYPFAQVGFFGPAAPCAPRVRDADGFMGLAPCLQHSAQDGDRMLSLWLARMKGPAEDPRAWSTANLQHLSKYDFDADALRSMASLTPVLLQLHAFGEGGCLLLVGVRGGRSVGAVLVKCWVE